MTLLDRLFGTRPAPAPDISDAARQLGQRGAEAAASRRRRERTAYLRTHLAQIEASIDDLVVRARVRAARERIESINQ